MSSKQIEVPEDLTLLTVGRLTDLANDLDDERIRVMLELRDRKARVYLDDGVKERRAGYPRFLQTILAKTDAKPGKSFSPWTVAAFLILAAMFTYARMAPEIRAMQASMRQQAATHQAAQPNTLPPPPLPPNGTGAPAKAVP